MSAFLTVGQDAPEIALTAVGSKRPFRLSAYSGRPVLLSFVDYKTQGVVRDLNRTLRQTYPEHEDVTAVTIIEAYKIPRLMRGMVRGIMDGAYQEAAKEVPNGRNPADYLILLPDWDNAIFEAYRVPDVGAYAALVVVNGRGQIAASYHGPNTVQQAMTQVTALLTA